MLVDGSRRYAKTLEAQDIWWIGTASRIPEYPKIFCTTIITPPLLRNQLRSRQMFSLLRTSGFASARRAFSTSPISRHDFAKITVLGRLATEPELITTPGGKEMVRYTVVVVSGKEKNSGKEVPVSYYRVANFDPDSPKRAFLMSCAKGSLVMVEGEATLRPYESEDGAKHFSFGVIQRTFTAIIPKRSQEQELQEKWASMAGA